MKRYETIAAFEAALRSRLHALETPQRTFQDLRRQVAFGRVLARLNATAPEVWLLKGGLALEYRIARARATMDIDISTELGVAEMSERLAQAAAADLDDYFEIEIGERERPVVEVETYRFDIAVKYADGRIFEHLKLDVGFADLWLGHPVNIEIPSLLDFAGITPITVRVIPAEQHLAEKIHAYSKSYGSYPSSRVKDLVDIALLLNESIDREELRTMLQTTFETRRTHAVPAALAPPPPEWRVPYARLADGLPVPRDLDASYVFANDQLTPLLASLQPKVEP